VAHCALAPDLARHDALPQLKAAESSEHYLDLEYLGGRALPETRAGFHKLCAELEIAPERVGTLPYAVVEAAQRLTLAFAEHRAHPENEHVKMRCLVYAGQLAHYAADLHMPLHTTVHWDGRAQKKEGQGAQSYRSPRTGIHARIDALPTKLPYAAQFDALPAPEAHADMFALVKRELAASHALVDRAYALEPKLPALEAMSLESRAVRRFTVDRMHAAAKLIASLQLSAWRNSKGLKLPDWHDRAIYDSGFDEATIPPQPQADSAGDG